MAAPNGVEGATTSGGEALGRAGTHALVQSEEPALSSPIGDWVWPAVGVAFALALVAAWLMSRPSEKPAISTPTEARTETKRAADKPAASRLFEGLARTREALRAGLGALWGSARVDLAQLEALEETLLLADVGVGTTDRLLEKVRAGVRGGEEIDGATLAARLQSEMRTLLSDLPPVEAVPRFDDGRPFVLLVVGVNGSGKTTTIGKLASRFAAEGHKVVLAAADTFRAAAADQLGIWAERTGAQLVRKEEGADPAAVAYAGMEAAKASGADVVIVDTAGRLQNARPLMEQLAKVRRVIGKQVAGAPHETWIVIDGTMGQNALLQAKAFHEATPLSGVVVTKLDGTAKGGMVLALAAELALPVRFVGVGEKVDDLRPFDGSAFVEALL